jgi:hypothetical protein
MNTKHQNYLNEAEAYFNASGDEFAYEGGSDVFAFNASDDESRLYADGTAASAQQAVTIPDFNRTYTLTLTNSSTDAPITIFGANQFINAVNFGLPVTVTATVGESSYQEMLSETQTAPFVISGFRVTSANPAQLEQVLQIRKRDGNGQIASYPLQIGTYFSAFQFQSGIREINPYNITFAGTTQIGLTLLASTTVVFTFFVGKRVEADNRLHSKPVIGVSTHKLPFVARQQLSLAPSAIAALKA